MFQVVYYIGMALIVLAALAVFSCLAHAYYEEYKKTPPEKQPKKLFEYIVTFLIVGALVGVGQGYIKNTEFAGKLWQGWAAFEGQPYPPSENTSFTDVLFDSEPKEYEKERQEIKP